MPHIQPIYLPPLYQESAESGRLILRDGTAAVVRVARPEDRDGIRQFFQRLSPESRRQRFFSAHKPNDDELASLCDSSRPESQLTLVVSRHAHGRDHLIAVASYYRKSDDTAEVALAVDDTFHGKGLGSLLLERLALLAARQGFMRFWAITQGDNVPMIEVFRRSGFERNERIAGDALEMEFLLEPTAESAARSEAMDRMFTTASLRPFFQPSAVAVVGASRQATSIGYRILEALLMNRYQGPIFPVNPRAAVVGSIRAYPSVREIPDPVDLAVIAVPRDGVLEVVDDCAVKGVRALVIISAGFAETGAEGRALQERLAEKVRGYGMRMVGPNCLGLLNTDPAVRLNASFSPVFPPAGRVAMLSQSGALGIAILSLARKMGLGLSKFVSVGNKGDVSGNDLIQYWEQDTGTDVILLYLESFGNPRRFARIARRVSRVKPIVAVKGGRTTAGSRAAGSHTAALAASDVAVEALFQQAGVIRADTLEEMFDLAATLSNQPLPRGRRVAIVTNAGGPGILCADACETGGLTVAELGEATRKQLAEFLPSAASVTNPIDMIASAPPEHYRRTVAAVLRDPEVDSMIIIHIPVGTALPQDIVQGMAEGILEGRQGAGADKPIIACLMGEEGNLHPMKAGPESIPTYLFPESAAGVLARITEYAMWRREPLGVFLDYDDDHPDRASEICRNALERYGPGWLTAEDSRDVLTAMGLPIVPGRVARTAEEAAQAAKELGFPSVVKLASRQIVHKTERAAVMLNLKDEAAVREAFERIRADLARTNELGAMDGVLVQPMLKGGVEVMIGVVEDPSFGPLIAFGLGGIHVEILRDVVFRISPLTDRDAATMVRSIRGYRLLEGYRGIPAGDVAAIEEVLLKISRLVEGVPEITEMDLNPIFAMAPGQGCRIADVRIRVAARQVQSAQASAEAPHPAPC